jgi:hypothetical protein
MFNARRTYDTVSGVQELINSQERQLAVDDDASKERR